MINENHNLLTRGSLLIEWSIFVEEDRGYDGENGEYGGVEGEYDGEEGEYDGADGENEGEESY